MPIIDTSAKTCAWLCNFRRLYSCGGGGGSRKLTLIPGDGIGPEITAAVQQIFKAAAVPIEWESVAWTPAKNNEGKLELPQNVLDSITTNRVAIKGPLAPVVENNTLLNFNVMLRKELQLYANVRPCRSFVGCKTNYGAVDVVTIRESTEGEYIGIEHEIVPGVVQSIKLTTDEAVRRVAEYTFKYAKKFKRRKVTCVHKANIMRMSDGHFLSVVRSVSEKFPDILFEERFLDTVCQNMIKNPKKFDVLVMPNLYGDIMSDLCCGLVGGPALAPSGNLGARAAVFEAVHGTVSKLAGKDAANPTALLLSSIMLLRCIKLGEFGDAIEKALCNVIKEGKHLTQDLGGTAKCSEFTNEVCSKLGETTQKC